MFDLQKIIRENIKNLEPYSSARDEFQGEASVFLDANENPFDNGLNRYPDPLQNELKLQISKQKQVHSTSIFLGNGSDEPIDLAIRAFCEPGQDNIVCIKPTYGMYKVCADINHVEFREVLLTEDFNLDVAALLEKVDNHTKLIFLCSPNNPTGNSLNRNDITNIIAKFEGIVVLDEAYIDFSSQTGFLQELANYPNLIILQTFSKAWSMAGIRLGMAFASPEIIRVLNRIKYPYNINVLTQRAALTELKNPDETLEKVKIILAERSRLIDELSILPQIKKIYPTDANFILVKVDDSKAMYNYFLKNEIIVRDRSKVALCMGCLRITIGKPEENEVLLKAWKDYN
jgi:histidinol-phosphate aminotransferase